LIASISGIPLLLNVLKTDRPIDQNFVQTRRAPDELRGQGVQGEKFAGQKSSKDTFCIKLIILEYNPLIQFCQRSVLMKFLFFSA
jgi:hypothetical protein